MLTKTYEQRRAQQMNTVELDRARKSQKALEYRNSNREGPVSSCPTKIRAMPPTDFRMFYDRGDLPVAIEHSSAGNKIIWKAEIDSLDYHHYLPIFVEGLREKQHPYAFLAREGVNNLLEHGKNRVLPVIPQLILPLHQGLETRDPEVICVILNVIQFLVMSNEYAGPALVPYYRQLLPVLNIFYCKNINIGDQIYYAQRKRQNMGDLIQETLELLEKKGGPDAFLNIKFMIPQYQSCVL
ncbi:Parkin_co-regulated protein [Hexamita inflata]|uniref:Parkin co-regulated protein n=1 Tax=Hexamita inflata TaxID=28002 RepID=A0AA86PGZ9_9EUKA|nr:Parkin co-regulated protein [Hexamita inflata]CAI9946373.1 Parkin co-regulated protein [Hexamita inflata]CAI9954510.1 Parkin co-regulated protein [Hexamita inflata]CAI9976893.1 Parkin co-regulated protein [Hexamita inflata]